MIRIATLAGLLLAGIWPMAAAAERPNVILIITDDQGYGDLGVHGNPKILTPTLDAFAKQAFQLRHFYVSPVCAPTRSSLLTGRYTYRTGVTDTYLGRAMMHPDEVTLAEALRENGYRTGLFGKWHLGDNYPLRPQDQGFEETLVIKGGGLGQPSDLPGGSSYFDPLLIHNGEPEKQKGYVSDVLTSAAMRFIESKSDKPFFVYLPFNCPHGPYEVSDAELDPYKKMNLGLDQFPKTGFPIGKKYDQATTARVYAMVSNIDKNLGRLFTLLDERRLADNTIVVFLTDNGPQQSRYNAGFRGQKGSVYEGGIRVPLYARWPGRFPAGKGSDVVAAHIDIMPTLLAACGVKPSDRKIDGVSLLPVLKGQEIATPDRTIFAQWHRGDTPVMGRACMARGPRYKIVQPSGPGSKVEVKEPPFELYDILNDPYEQTNLADKHPDILRGLKTQYESWFADVKKEREFQPPRIVLGSTHENPSLLTRQDWRGPNAGWTAGDEGYWEVSIDRAGKYRVTLRADAKGVGHAAIGKSVGQSTFANGKAVVEVNFPKGDGRLETWIVEGEKRFGPKYLEVERVGD
jgi:arylsulfatase A-like enzyme